MRRLWAILFCLPLFAATVPGRYIVELSLEPAGARVGRSHTPQAEAYRAQIRTQQAAARGAIEQAGGRILGTLENLRNALFVEIPAAQAAQLGGLPNVRRVHPVRLFHLTLDHALPLHHVPSAWAQVGFGNAGAGSKIAFIDTGIEIAHPGFADAGFTAPSGFPMADTSGDLALANNKVIVARSYAGFFTALDPDPTVRDHVGHGTATAMAAAGVTNTGPLTTITGVAPQAYIGVYKVFGTPGVNDGAPEDAILSAMEDAVNDGMDVMNLSLGDTIAGDLDFDPLVQAVEVASGLGVIVVVSAGNGGPNPGTMGTPATAPHAIAVGASANDRAFMASVQTPGGAIAALPGAGPNSFSPIGGPLVDLSTLDGNGLACNGLPANSLSNSVALIFRGLCTFETKLDNAQAAGALAAVVYDNIPDESPVLMGVGAASLPAVMVANQDGLNLRQQAFGGATATLQFYAPAYINPQSLAAFSSAGPNVNYSIKPDLVAVGENFYTAAQTADSDGELYDPSGYIITQGTSFSAPSCRRRGCALESGAARFDSGRIPLAADRFCRSGVLASGDRRASAAGGRRISQYVIGVQRHRRRFASLLSFGAAAAPAPCSRSLPLPIPARFRDTFQVSATARDPGAPGSAIRHHIGASRPGASAALPVAFPGDGLAAGSMKASSPFRARLRGHSFQRALLVRRAIRADRVHYGSRSSISAAAGSSLNKPCFSASRIRRACR